jgi:hypothetical protein
MTRKPEVLFQYEKDGRIWRGVRAADGGYRMERKGPTAKKFKAFMWCGGERCLDVYRAEAEGGRWKS